MLQCSRTDVVCSYFSHTITGFTDFGISEGRTPMRKTFWCCITSSILYLLTLMPGYRYTQRNSIAIDIFASYRWLHRNLPFKWEYEIKREKQRKSTLVHVYNEQRSSFYCVTSICCCCSFVHCDSSKFYTICIVWFVLFISISVLLLLLFWIKLGLHWK